MVPGAARAEARPQEPAAGQAAPGRRRAPAGPRQHRTGSNGRLHHIAFATDTREEILRAADLCLDNDVCIETGPHKHAIQQTFFLYVYEPGGNRIELCNPLTRLVLAPDRRLITWTEEERATGQAWGPKTIASFHTHGAPPVD